MKKIVLFVAVTFGMCVQSAFGMDEGRKIALERPKTQAPSTHKMPSTAEKEWMGSDPKLQERLSSIDNTTPGVSTSSKATLSSGRLSSSPLPSEGLRPTAPPSSEEPGIMSRADMDRIREQHGLSKTYTPGSAEDPFFGTGKSNIR